MIMSISVTSDVDITLSSLAETGQSESTIPVLNQRTYTGEEAIPRTRIPSALANTPCEVVVDEVGTRVPSFPTLTRTLYGHVLSCLEETGRSESTIPVLNQRTYTGKEAIPSALANTPCTDLSVSEVIHKLSLWAVSPTNNIHSATIQSYISQNYDLGTAYARLRHVRHDTISIEGALRCLKMDWERRKSLVVDNRITEWIAVPRRVWDLHANRVVPWWVACTWPWGISHAWMSDEERMDVMTPINGYEWPVPIPKDANLDLIRIEMLNLGAEYAWLDVLCLRQTGGRRDDLRAEEWKVDVPTIGSIYHMAPEVVCYFSGLGRPLSLTPGDFESERCWFRRAWTLQEVTNNPIIGGLTDTNGTVEKDITMFHEPLQPPQKTLPMLNLMSTNPLDKADKVANLAYTGNDGITEKDIQKRFHEKLQPLQTIRAHVFLGVFKILSQMQNRVSTKPLDKVAGLAYLLKPKYIPVYDATQCEEDAWVALVNGMQEGHRMELLFMYPEPGDGRKCWRPSWNQVMTKTLPDARKLWSTNVVGTDKTDTDWVEAHCIETGDVLGLADGSSEGNPRKGELVVQDNTGAPRTFNILADHAFPIPDGAYTLVGSTRFGKISHHFVVGCQRQDGKFEKLSVIRLADNEEIWSLQKLKAAQRFAKTFLC